MAQPTNLAVTVRHAPSLNGSGRIEGSLQQMLGENVTLNGGFTLTGDFLVPGSPALRTNGNPVLAGIIAGTGSALPSGYQVTLNGNCSLKYLRPRTAPIQLPTVAAPPQPVGTRGVTINKAGQSFGDPATLRDLTLNGNVGLVSVPPGTYGNFTANGGSGLVLGVAGGLQAVNYNLQNLTLNGQAVLKVVGPVVLTVANGFTANGMVGASNNPPWLQLRAASGGCTLNGGCTVYGLVAAPNGTVMINGNSLLAGTAASDQFTLNGGGVVRWAGTSAQIAQPPVANNQTITLAENTFTNITLTGCDPQGLALTFSVLTQPAHGSLCGTPPGVAYRPGTNYFGLDAFTFKASNGLTDSAPATISLAVTQVYYLPVAYAQSLTNYEDTALSVTLTGSDPQGYALSYSVLAQPAHGSLTGMPPNLTYLPATNYFGNDAFIFRVNDGISNSASATISITNQPVDDAPAVEAGPDQFIILPTNFVWLTGSVAFDAFPGTVDTVAWSECSGPGTVTFSEPSNTVTRASFSTNGVYRLRLEASDSFLSNCDDLSITVDAPPEVNAGLSRTNTFPGSFDLPGTVIDDGLPTNGTLTVHWSLISGPGTVMLGDASLTNSPATFSTNGVYVLRLTADDGIATNHSDLILIENRPPAVNIGPNILTNGLQAGLTGCVTDDGWPGGDLAVQWSQLSGPGTIAFGNNTATNTTITVSQSGTYVLTLTASDGAATNSAEMGITFNLPPAVTAGPAQTVNFGDTFTLAGAVTDDQLPYNVLHSSWRQLSGPGEATFADNTLTNTTVTFDQPGSYVLRLTADDGWATNTADVAVELLPPTNVPPVVAIISPVASSEFPVGLPIPLTATASDSDGVVVGVSIRADGNLLAEWTEPPFTCVWTNAMPGDHVLTARATDDSGATTVSAEVLLVVLEPEHGDFTVEAGPDQIISLPNAVSLAGIVAFPKPVADSPTNVIWSKLDGPGDVQFSDANGLSTTAICSEPGSYVLKLQVTYAGGIRSDTLQVDVLPLPPNRLTVARSNRGTDFWLTFLNNAAFNFEPQYFGHDLYISADVDTVGTVDFSDGTSGQRFQVPAGSTTIISAWQTGLEVSDSVQLNAIHVTADHPVTIHGLNYLNASTDGYLALPTAMLGNDYIILSYRNSPTWYDTNEISGGTQFAVVASENDTCVTITPSVTTDSRSAGVPYLVLLQPGETYRLINYDDVSADLTGTTIQSDKPIAVLAGHTCAYVPTGVGYADHLVEQLPPVNQWGRHFVTLPLAARANGDTFRFLAATSGTRLAINGKIVASLDRGQFYEQILEGPAEILASQPILVAQYAHGQDFDGQVGDPFMMLVPALEQLGGDCVLATPSFWVWSDMKAEDIYADHLNLIVRTNGMGLIQLDDALVPAGQFQLIGASGYAGAQLPINPGTHHLAAPVPFGACIYGWAWCESYAFWNGIYSDTAESDTRLELTQPTPFAAVGHEKTVYAQVTNGRGRPIPDLELSFSASGANPVAGRGLTSRFGPASFSYTGTHAGPDLITVSLGDFHQSVTNTWIAESDNAPPVVSTTGTPPLQLGLTAQLAGVVTDDGHPLGAPLNFGWRFLSGPGDVQLEDPTQLSTRAFCSEPGTYRFELDADDSQFSSRALVSVTVVRPFTVTVGGVDPGSWFSTNAQINLYANTDIFDGIFTNVEFFDGNQKLSEGLSTSLTLDSPAPGEHSITAVVTDEHGFQVRSDPLVFGVTFPPQIEVLLPDQDLTLPYGDPATTFKARAWDPDGTIVDFSIHLGFWGFAQQIYQTNGDEIDFTGPAQDEGADNVLYGSVPIRFVATDNHGISTEVAPVSIDFQPPVINTSILSPTNGASFRFGQTIDLIARASETSPARLTEGCFKYQPFWSWSWYGMDNWTWANGLTTTEPHLSRWTPPEIKDYRIVAGAQAPGFDFQYSPIITIHVLPAIGVAVFSPTNSEQWYVGTPAPIILSLEDPTEVFDHAEFFADGTSLGLMTNLWCEWTPPQIGAHTLTAKVYDHQGQSYDADASVTIQAVPPPPPEIVITSPTTGDRLAMGQQTFVSVEVTDPAQAVTNLELLVDGIKATDTPDSYIPWTPVAIGDHSLTAVAADWNSNRVISAPVTVTIVEMHPPIATVTSPADGIHYAVETLPLLHAEATDSDGTVTNLTLELDGAVMGKTNNTVLELSVTNISGGWHSVLARATDNDGLTGVSTGVSFFIDRSVDVNLPVPQKLAADALSANTIRLAWLPAATNITATSILVECWNPAQSAWAEIAKTSITETNYTDSNLTPETCYRYRIATTDDKVHRSAYSAEVQATTRTVVPLYTAIDLTEALIASLTGPSANILTNAGLHHFDSRRTSPLGASHAETILGTNTTALKLAVARFKERWPLIQLDFDPVLLSPKSVMPRLGYLTGPGGAGITVSDATAQLFDPADPDRPIKAFLQEYQTLFGFGPEALNDAVVQRDYVSTANGARTVGWQQQLAGVPVFNALLIGHITPAGELACLSSEFIPSPDQAADPALLAAVESGADLPFSAPQALAAAVTNAGDRFGSGSVTAETDADGITRRQTSTASTGIKGDARAELTWFPAGRAQLKLCWQVLFTSQWRDEMYLTLVTADTGEIVYRRNLTAESATATYRVYTNASPAPLLPGLPAPGTTQPAAMDRSLVTLTALDDTASPNGWIADADNETRGNNVDAHLDRNDDNLADLPRPTGNPPRVFDFPLDLTLAPANYGEAATVQLFYWANWMHDALYELGFTEAAGNFQTDNFGRGGLGDDAVQADAQDGLSLNDGRHVNNANMSTPPEGCAPRMQMYLFNGVAPGRDGALEAQIVLHEYTHGLSSRLVGGGAGIDALQTAGLGEGWSDFYALALLTDPAADIDGVYPMASYAAYHGFGTTFEENYYYGIRRYPYCTDINKNPLTFADIDPAKASAHDGVPRNPLAGPFRADLAGEVHGQGEAWCMMLWEMRANLIRKLGPAAGNHLALQLVTDGLKLSPPNPNFVQARDAILLAERMWTGGTNAAEIWSAFAKRGLGFNAGAPESYTTSGAQESRELMPALAAERVEIQTASGAIDLGADNNLVIHLRNQGDTAATHVSGQLTTTTAGVSVGQGVSAYADIPQSGSRANNTVFQIQTGAGFVEGTPIDFVLVINSDQYAGTNYLRLFTGVPGAEILFDDYSALAEPDNSSTATRDLTPWNIAKAEPLWMADDASCLLKLGTNRYALWKPDGRSYLIDNTNFLAHRLTRSGAVVGTLTVTNTVDEWTNKINGSVGAAWSIMLSKPIPLTRGEYRWQKDAPPRSFAGMVYSLTNLLDGQPTFLTNVTLYPTLQDLWDLSSGGVGVGSVSVQESFTWEQVLFGADGTMNWFKPSERGLDAGVGTDSVTAARYFALLTTAAQFNNIESWRWLGPLSSGNSTAVALLVNDAGMIAGYGGIYTGDPQLDALRPTHAFRAPAFGEYDGASIILTNDLGVLPGGLHSFPRAMNQAGALAGYSDFDFTNTGVLTFNQYNSHAVFWGPTNRTPEYLTNLPPSWQASFGFGDAFALNDSNQIVGATMTFDGRLVAALWQLNHNTSGVSDTNGLPSTTNAPYWEITDLNNRLTDMTWQIFRAVGINNDNLILAHAASASGEKHAVLLVPMAMAVDNNRDGQITFDESDATAAGCPYRFWINDSQEGGDEVAVAEVQIPGIPDHPWNGGVAPPPVPILNYQRTQVNGCSDLINFFPVALKLGNALRTFPPSGGYEYRLSISRRPPPEQETGSVKFIYTSLPLANAFDYLTNTASSGYGINSDQAATNADTIEVLGIPGTPLDNNWLARVQTNNGTGIILVEGCATTTQPLQLQIWRNGTLLGGVPLHLSISGVEQMFRHLNLCAYANGAVEVSSRAIAANEPPTKDKNFVFLHGYNVNQQEARGVLSEVFKRMYWSGSQAKFYGVTWNGALTKEFASIQAFPPEKQFTPNYHTNVYNAFLTAPHLASFLGGLPGETVVAAHSLGNMAVLSALNDCTNVDFTVKAFFMIDAAVAMEAVQSTTPDTTMIYSAWRPYAPRLYASDWWQLFPADDGRGSLTWSNRLNNFRNTDIYNFYSSGEEVLRRYNVDPPPGVLYGLATEVVENWVGRPYGSYVWVWQEKGKGTSWHDNFIGSTHGGWKFSYYWRDQLGNSLSPDSMEHIPNSRLAEQPFFSVGSSANRPPDQDLLEADASAYARANRNRILSDAIPAITLPVGANPVDVLGRTHNIDMQKELKNSWPLGRSLGPEAGMWYHSDFVYVAYPFTHKLFDQFVTLGNLK
ncbi:MAG TPA: M36 family metallopeptidase [Candidatus Acidoferrum sp.]|nr:M36 family metallopeptidase [Candidatus Acidoferrum sp.]